MKSLKVSYKYPVFTHQAIGNLQPAWLRKQALCFITDSDLNNQPLLIKAWGKSFPGAQENGLLLYLVPFFSSPQPGPAPQLVLGSLLFASGHAPCSERTLLVLASSVQCYPSCSCVRICLTHNQCSNKNMLIITVKKKNNNNRKQQVLTRTKGNQKPISLLVEMQIDAAVM